MSILTMKGWFNQLFPAEVDGTNSVYPFKLRAAIAGYAVTPRHPIFQNMLETGFIVLEAIVLHQPLPFDAGTTLLLVLPERWLSIHEQRGLLERLRTHPDVGLIACVEIVTQNPLIVGGATQECLRVFNIAADDPHQGWVQS